MEYRRPVVCGKTLLKLRSSCGAIFATTNCTATSSRRQEPIGKYIVDFLCYRRRLVVELDGGQHQEQADYDNERTRWLKSRGFKVIRFWNDDVLKETDGVLEAILIALRETS